MEIKKDEGKYMNRHKRAKHRVRFILLLFRILDIATGVRTSLQPLSNTNNTYIYKTLE